MYTLKRCSTCGREIAETAVMCPHCGAPNGERAVHYMHSYSYAGPDISPKNWLATLLLCFFLGGLGVHSFYAGKTLIGIIQLLTLGGCGIWTLIDFIMILCGSYKDAEGRLIVNGR